MNWTSFLLTLTLIYLAYYGLNLLYDLLMSRKSPASDSKGDTLFFEEDIQPEIIEYIEQPTVEPELATDEPSEPITPKVAPVGIPGNVISTGAVGIKDLFNLAKSNLIEHTSAIPY